MYESLECMKTSGKIIDMYWRKVRDVWLLEIEDLISVIKEESHVQPIDISKLAVSGHSCGGITALESIRQFSRDIKFCVAFDPWFIFLSEELSNG